MGASSSYQKLETVNQIDLSSDIEDLDAFFRHTFPVATTALSQIDSDSDSNIFNTIRNVK